MNNKTVITKNSLRLLTVILNAEATNQLSAVPISTISKKIDVSTMTIRNSIKSLIEWGYVGEGFIQKNAKTYYITKTGIAMVHEILKDVKGGVRQ